MAYLGTRHHASPRLLARSGSEVLFEMRRTGAWLKVAAVDPETGEEAVAVGPAANPEAVRQAAAAKLRRKLARQADRA